MKKIALLLGFKSNKHAISNDYLITEFLLVIVLIILSIIIPLTTSAQSGKDGSVSYTTAATRILNRYSALASSASSGSYIVSVSAIADLSGSTSFSNSVNPYTTAALSPGDLVFIIQMLCLLKSLC